MKRIISFLLSLLFVLVLALVVIPWILFFKTEPFSGKLFFTIFYFVMTLDKIWSTFFKTPERVKAEARNDWTTVSVGYSYLAVWYIAIFDYYLNIRDGMILYVAGFGVALYILAVIMRYWILHYLGHQWTVHVDEKVGDRHLIRTGPYRFVRHPLYAEAFMEAVGISLALCSVPALAVAVLVFIPLEIHRAYFEEKYLKEIFGDEYIDYKKSVRAFFPLPSGKKTDSNKSTD